MYVKLEFDQIFHKDKSKVHNLKKRNNFFGHFRRKRSSHGHRERGPFHGSIPARQRRQLLGGLQRELLYAGRSGHTRLTIRIGRL